MRITALCLVLSACSRPGAGDLRDDHDTSTDSTTLPGSGSPIEGDRRFDCSGMDPADRGPMDGWIALTFDDGPALDTTPRILDVLRARNIPATFFTVGERLSDPAVWPLVEEMAADPLFELGNHSYFHPDMTTLSLDVAREEVETTDALLRSFGVVPRYLRFPYGSSTCETADMVRDEFGYHVVGWHADTADWCYASDGTCEPWEYWRIDRGLEADNLEYILRQVRAFDGGVVLAHDIHSYTANSLDTVLQALVDEGFRFTTLDDLDVLPRLNADDPYPFPWMGEPCSTEDDLCWQVEWLSWCEPTGDPDAPADAGICVLPCDGFRRCFDRDGAPPVSCVAHQGEALCLAEPSEENAWCDATPGTTAALLPSSPPDSDVEVCQPTTW